MDVHSTTQTSQPSTTDTTSRGHSHRRPKRGRGGESNSALAFRPASVVPDGVAAPSNAQSTQNASLSSEQPHSVSNRGRGRGRGRARAGRIEQARTVNGRQFGGQLTRQDTNDTSDLQITGSHSKPSLQADAVAFVPGQQYANGQNESRMQSQSIAQRHQKRRMSKSQAPDIATRTHQDIDNGFYECLICMNEVRRNSKVWSCHTCWSVFHLGCIKKWSTNEGSVAAQQNAQSQDGDLSHSRQWRCPGCNLPKSELPHTYTCWCEKDVEPRSSPGLPPHSCGNTCGKERARVCPHPCNLTCHAGPHPPCEHLGHTQICFCGKHETTKRCSETDYDKGWSCGELCGELLPCSEHECSRLCHEGLCGACEFPVVARCYCGQAEREIACGDRGETQESQRADSPLSPANNAGTTIESWTGSFECGKRCSRRFDCLEHTCKKQCHTQTAAPSHCPYSVDVVTHCPCGKTPLERLLDHPRQQCTDPIPQCVEQCGRMQMCGHLCELSCHAGDCSPCMKTVDTKCRCGRTTSKRICHQAQEELPECTRPCKTLLNCRRHECSEICCPGERKALERQGGKRKQRPLGAQLRPVEDLFEAEHICTLECGRLLTCGTHHCPELCHKGSCNSCREAVFDEISCHCGRTVLQPPLPCGTKPPPCSFPCIRQKACGHPAVSHTCHQDEVGCPKCPYLVEKACMCGKKKLKNQPCWLVDVRCGQVCDKVLHCGSHKCRKLCHRPGECEDANGQPCEQPCGKAKKTCGHPDMEHTCHAPFSCKEDTPCQSKIYIFCNCQAQKQEMKCGASKSSEGNGAKSLPCNEECARLERNRKLATALNIDQSKHIEGGDHIPYATETLTLFAEHVKWAQQQEREFRVFADSLDEKRLRFKPMRSQQRAFIHALADDFGFDSESMDPEPHRHVMIWKTPRFVSPPHKTLADALRVRHAQRAANASANLSDTEDASKKATKASSQPFNSFVIHSPRFGLTIDELRTETNAILGSDKHLTFGIEFLPSEEVVMKAHTRVLSDIDLQQMLQTLKPQITSAVNSNGFGTAELCSVDSSLNIVRRESDIDQASDGWSKVAAKKAAPKTSLASTSTVGSNAFAALGNGKVTFAKKPEKPKMKPKPKKEAVVDDWEAAELAEEEKENESSGATDSEAPVVAISDSKPNGAPAVSTTTSVGHDSFAPNELTSMVAATIAELADVESETGAPDTVKADEAN